MIRTARALGLLRETEEMITLTRSGSFWLHLIQNHFSLSYINRIWSIARTEPWPASIAF